MKQDEDTFITVLSTILSIPIGTVVLWFTWNHFTDPDHPLRFSYVLVTQLAVAFMETMVVFVIFLVRRR